MFKKLIIISLGALIANLSNASEPVHPVIHELAARFGTTPNNIVPALLKAGFNIEELKTGTVHIPTTAVGSIRQAITNKKAKPKPTPTSPRKNNKAHRSNAKVRRK